jgi:hypothetical protein
VAKVAARCQNVDAATKIKREEEGDGVIRAEECSHAAPIDISGKTKSIDNNFSSTTKAVKGSTAAKRPSVTSPEGPATQVHLAPLPPGGEVVPAGGEVVPEGGEVVPAGGLLHPNVPQKGSKPMLDREAKYWVQCSGKFGGAGKKWISGKKGLFYPEKYNGYKECILSAGAWYKLSGFEKFSGSTNKNPTHTIKIQVDGEYIPLYKVIEGDHLRFKTDKGGGKPREPEKIEFAAENEFLAARSLEEKKEKRRVQKCENERKRRGLLEGVLDRHRPGPRGTSSNQKCHNQR